MKTKNALFLDTHVLVFLFNKKIKPFSKQGLQLLNECDLFVSPIVSLELQYLYQKGNVIDSPAPVVLDFLNKSMDIEIDDLLSMELISSALELGWTRDVFDRLITAHAKCYDCRLLTRDGMITENYHKTVW